MTLRLLAAALGAASFSVAAQAPASAPAAAAPAASATKPPMTVGFVYVSPVSDAGWTSQHNRGRLQMEQALKGQVTTRFVEKVSEGADAERVIREMASSGAGLIFTTSFGFMDPTIRVAQQFPNVRFVHATGFKTAPNVATVNARFYEGRYLAGMAAGRTTKSNVIGYVAAFPIPEVLQGINAFTRGAREVNPKAEVRVVWTASWFDPPKERDAATTLANQKADVLTHHTDSTAVVAVAEERGIRAVAYHSDMSKFGPKAQIVAVTHHWGDYYTQAARDVLAGTWKTSQTWGGIKAGMIKLDGWNANVPADVRKAIDARQADIVAGKFHPFTGPVKDNTGKVVWEKGAMDDASMGKMNYLVEGVVGNLPK
ncbi:MAG TPA: BMP family ABC transporter substrate-binding protein [Burkholderiaceae bacterium]|nr:BMP family ABC transporter substrate-binding protein [Burkholderiaceae bacterium]